MPDFAGSQYLRVFVVELMKMPLVGMPVVEHFETKGKVVKIMATRGPDEVYEDVKKAMKERGFDMKK